MIIRFFKKIMNLGIHDNTDKNEIHYITFTNVLIIINGLALIFYTPYLFFSLPESKVLLIVVLLQILLYLVTLVVNFLQLYLYARYFLCIVGLFFTIIETVVTNYYCDIHFFLIIGVVFAFLAFPDKQRKYSYFISISFAIIFVILEIHASLYTSLSLPPVFIMKIKYIIRLSFLFLVFFFAYYSFTTIRGFQIELEDDNERMEAEIILARNIQQQLIPSKDPSENIYSLYKPMNQVGGDFYDFIFFNDSNKIGIFLSDVSGHGVPAAFITTMIKTAILQSGSVKENPSSFLMFLNNILIQQSGGNFITAFYGIYDLEDRSLLFSNAGHNSPFIIDISGISKLKGGKSIPLAIVDNNSLLEKGKAYFNSKVYLEKNSKLLLYTDGMVEAGSKKNNKILFENAGMYQLFNDYRSLDCKDFICNIYNDLVKYCGNETFEDDICMICIDVV